MPQIALTIHRPIELERPGIAYQHVLAPQEPVLLRLARYHGNLDLRRTCRRGRRGLRGRWGLMIRRTRSGARDARWLSQGAGCPSQDWRRRRRDIALHGLIAIDSVASCICVVPRLAHGARRCSSEVELARRYQRIRVQDFLWGGLITVVIRAQLAATWKKMRFVFKTEFRKGAVRKLDANRVSPRRPVQSPRRRLLMR